MARVLCDQIVTQLDKAIELTRRNILAFSEDNWLKGVSEFEVPAKVAYHIVDALDYYFREDRGAKYVWGHRFGGSWRQLPPDRLPSISQIAEYLDETRERIHGYFENTDDAFLEKPHARQGSELGYAIYAIRHTMHHQGALNVLAIYHKTGFDDWE
jgi:hypothetical protein